MKPTLGIKNALRECVIMGIRRQIAYAAWIPDIVHAVLNIFSALPKHPAVRATIIKVSIHLRAMTNILVGTILEIRGNRSIWAAVGVCDLFRVVLDFRIPALRVITTLMVIINIKIPAGLEFEAIQWVEAAVGVRDLRRKILGIRVQAALRIPDILG